jgi:hypothetical protein
MTHKFLKYIENEKDPQECYGLMGIAVVSKFDGGQIDHYTVKAGRDGQGYYVQPMAQKMNDTWFKASLLDSNYDDQELGATIRKEVSTYYERKTKPAPEKAFDDSSCPF